jgi:predicted DNA-binding transcriptional regulator AlpA
MKPQKFLKFGGPTMTRLNIPTDKTGTDFERLLTEKDVADLLQVSRSWLAKARMRGDGPPFVMVGRSIRYTGPGIRQWTRSCQRFSTSEQ